MADEIKVVRIGMPGPQGAGVTPAEKASYLTASGANTFTNVNSVRKTSTGAFNVENDGGTGYFVVDTTNGDVELQNSAKLRGFSDANTTETFSIDASTGDMQLDGILTVDGGVIKGEQLWWSFEFDGGGVALTTGVKRRWKIPYNCQLVVDANQTGTPFWEVGLDQSGSIGFDLWMDTYANYPPTNADRISGTIASQNPRVSTATKAQSATTTGWTLDLVKGRYLFISIDSITTAQWATLSLHVKKT